MRLHGVSVSEDKAFADASQDILFRISLPHDEYVVIPPRYIDSIKNLPAEQLSLTENVGDRLFDRGTRLMAGTHTVFAASRRDFPRYMDDMLPVMLDEIQSAVSTTLGSCQGTT